MSVYLRVKRLRSDSHIVDKFETDRVSKLPRLDPTPSVFRYIGSQPVAEDLCDNDLNALTKSVSNGTCKLILDKKKGRIVDENKENCFKYKVVVQTLKRPAQQDLDSCVPSKLIRIINITPVSLTDASLAPTLIDSISLNPTPPGSCFSDQVDCVYDLYRHEPKRSRCSSGCSVGEDTHETHPIVFDDLEDQSDSDVFNDDEDDSNSESNWRNDYPDEESTDTSEEESNSSRSLSDDHDDDDGRWSSYRRDRDYLDVYG